MAGYNKGEVELGNGRWIPSGAAYLNHSCDEWVIGTAENVRELIEDLQALLDSGVLDSRSLTEAWADTPE